MGRRGKTWAQLVTEQDPNPIKSLLIGAEGPTSGSSGSELDRFSLPAAAQGPKVKSTNKRE
jgi:hypothetical protein